MQIITRARAAAAAAAAKARHLLRNSQLAAAQAYKWLLINYHHFAHVERKTGGPTVVTRPLTATMADGKNMMAPVAPVAPAAARANAPVPPYPGGGSMSREALLALVKASDNVPDVSSTSSAAAAAGGSSSSSSAADARPSNTTTGGHNRSKSGGKEGCVICSKCGLPKPPFTPPADGDDASGDGGVNGNGKSAKPKEPMDMIFFGGPGVGGRGDGNKADADSIEGARHYMQLSPPLTVSFVGHKVWYDENNENLIMLKRNTFYSLPLNQRVKQMGQQTAAPSSAKYELGCIPLGNVLDVKQSTSRTQGQSWSGKMLSVQRSDTTVEVYRVCPPILACPGSAEEDASSAASEMKPSAAVAEKRRMRSVVWPVRCREKRGNCILRGGVLWVPRRRSMARSSGATTAKSTRRVQRPSPAAGTLSMGDMLVLVTRYGIEIYSIPPTAIDSNEEAPSHKCQLHHTIKHAVQRFWYHPSDRFLILATGQQGRELRGYLLNMGDGIASNPMNAAMPMPTKLGRFVLPTSPAQKNVFLCRLYHDLYCILVDHQSAQLRLYRLTPSNPGTSAKGGAAGTCTHILHTYTSGKVNLSVVDGLLCVHNMDTGVSLLFDVRDPSPEPFVEPLPLTHAVEPNSDENVDRNIKDETDKSSSPQKAEQSDRAKRPSRATALSPTPCAYTPNLVFLAPCFMLDAKSSKIWEISINLSAIVRCRRTRNIRGLATFLLRRDGPGNVRSLKLKAKPQQQQQQQKQQQQQQQKQLIEPSETQTKSEKEDDTGKGTGTDLKNKSRNPGNPKGPPETDYGYGYGYGHTFCEYGKDLLLQTLRSLVKEGCEMDKLTAAFTAINNVYLAAVQERASVMRQGSQTQSRKMQKPGAKLSRASQRPTPGAVASSNKSSPKAGDAVSAISSLRLHKNASKSTATNTASQSSSTSGSTSGAPSGSGAPSAPSTTPSDGLSKTKGVKPNKPKPARRMDIRTRSGTSVILQTDIYRHVLLPLAGEGIRDGVSKAVIDYKHPPNFLTMAEMRAQCLVSKEDIYDLCGHIDTHMACEPVIGDHQKKVREEERKEWVARVAERLGKQVKKDDNTGEKAWDDVVSTATRTETATKTETSVDGGDEIVEDDESDEEEGCVQDSVTDSGKGGKPKADGGSTSGSVPTAATTAATKALTVPPPSPPPVDTHWLIQVVTEYIRILCNKCVPVEQYLFEFLCNLMLSVEEYHQIWQLCQHNVFSDSVAIAQSLLYAGDYHPPLWSTGMDMLFRLGEHRWMTDCLLRKRKLFPAMQFVRRRPKLLAPDLTVDLLPFLNDEDVPGSAGNLARKREIEQQKSIKKEIDEMIRETLKKNEESWAKSDGKPNQQDVKNIPRVGSKTAASMIQGLVNDVTGNVGNENTSKAEKDNDGGESVIEAEGNKNPRNDKTGEGDEEKAKSGGSGEIPDVTVDGEDNQASEGGGDETDRPTVASVFAEYTKPAVDTREEEEKVFGRRFRHGYDRPTRPLHPLDFVDLGVQRGVILTNKGGKNEVLEVSCMFSNLWVFLNWWGGREMTDTYLPPAGRDVLERYHGTEPLAL